METEQWRFRRHRKYASEIVVCFGVFGAVPFGQGGFDRLEVCPVERFGTGKRHFSLRNPVDQRVAGTHAQGAAHLLGHSCLRFGGYLTEYGVHSCSFPPYRKEKRSRDQGRTPGWAAARLAAIASCSCFICFFQAASRRTRGV